MSQIIILPEINNVSARKLWFRHLYLRTVQVYGGGGEMSCKDEASPAAYSTTAQHGYFSSCENKIIQER